MENIKNIKGEEKNISGAEAVKIVKDYFGMVKGSRQIAGMGLMEWLDFTTISVKPQTGGYIIICKFKKMMFSDEYEIHKLEVDFERDIMSDEIIETKEYKNKTTENKNEST